MGQSVARIVNEYVLVQELSGQEMGSGPNLKPLDQYFCANSDVLAVPERICQNAGKLKCSKCQLVGYCLVACQKEHWKKHKQHCRASPFLDSHWEPGWIKEQRMPTFRLHPSQDVPFGLGINLWGNTPAFDLMNFLKNETKTGIYDHPMTIGFIASGNF